MGDECFWHAHMWVESLWHAHKCVTCFWHAHSVATIFYTFKNGRYMFLVRIQCRCNFFHLPKWALHVSDTPACEWQVFDTSTRALHVFDTPTVTLQCFTPPKWALHVSDMPTRALQFFEPFKMGVACSWHAYSDAAIFTFCMFLAHVMWVESLWYAQKCVTCT